MDNKPLNGIYRVSFDIEIDSQDHLSLSDLAQSLTEGFGEGLLEKASHLSIESIEKHGENKVQVLKIGDKVQLKNSLQIKADIYSDDGYHFVGKPTEISEIITNEAAIIDVEAGSIGFVNHIEGNKVEVVDLDRPITKYAEIGIDFINIDLVTIDAEQLEKIDLDEVK